MPRRRPDPRCPGVSCPRCGADANKPCRTPNRAPLKYPHALRVQKDRNRVTQSELETRIHEYLRDNLTIEVGAASSDPEDDTRQVSIYLGDEEIASADL